MVFCKTEGEEVRFLCVFFLDTGGAGLAAADLEHLLMMWMPAARDMTAALAEGLLLVSVMLNLWSAFVLKRIDLQKRAGRLHSCMIS
ncbi:hypothetical protein ACIQXV_03645 [Neobacillus sp. NPDC097160]|uniref:hypothetical protein n=1 Tax=Neobacillus sp. NPDC097160 TaxID=3364298 RepID=UPI00382CCFC7